MPSTDAELIAAALQGDRSSFGRLYVRYYRLAVGMARSRVSDVQLAEDAAQEAFAVAFRTLSSLQDHNRFPQWLGTICQRTAARMAVKQQSHQTLSDSHEAVRDSTQATLQQQVQEALEQLDEASREIVVLHYFSGLSYEEIADALELTEAAIHGRLQRARQKLAKSLDAYDPTGTTG